MSGSILMIDDSPISRKMIQTLFPKGEYDILEASGGREGVDIYKEQGADLIFLDLTMPELDGFETLELLKEIDPEVKVVIVSADVQHASEITAIELGAVGFIQKPPTTEQFKPFFDRYLP